MSSKLVYHTEDDATSPFDTRAVAIARNANLCIACPYLSLEYLRRLTTLSQSWRLLTDIEEWLASCRTTARKGVCRFISKNAGSIRHLSGLHAKVLIGAKSALVGSCNFTTSGIRRRTEMAVFLDDKVHHSELVNWFQGVWRKGHDVPVNKLSQLVVKLPEKEPLRRYRLFENGKQRHAPLMELDEVRESEPPVRTQPSPVILRFQGARGYYTGPGRQFCVMKGSRASGFVSNAFISNSNGTYNGIRDSLIKWGVLARSQHGDDFVFTQDYTFNASSPAACIVDGQSRSGPRSWRK